MAMRIVLLSPLGEIRQVYCDELKKNGINPDVVTNFKELYDTMAQNSYNGIVLDFKTKLKAPKEEVNLVMNIIERFPVAELRWDTKTKKIGIYYQGQHKEGGNLDDFFNRVCRLYDANKISVEKRFDIHLSVILSKSEDLKEENIEKTISLDISKHGCFLFSKDKWKSGDIAWFIFKDISDQTPITGKVRWSAEWGNGLQPPGIGIEFDKFKHTQLNEIFNLLQAKGRQRRTR
jgi:Tfp pilus assembly protein PilZ